MNVIVFIFFLIIIFLIYLFLNNNERREKDKFTHFSSNEEYHELLPVSHLKVIPLSKVSPDNLHLPTKLNVSPSNLFPFISYDDTLMSSNLPDGGYGHQDYFKENSSIYPVYNTSVTKSFENRRKYNT